MDPVLLLSSSTNADWLALLDYGTFEVADDGRRIPIMGYAIASSGRVILVDTGFPDAYYDDPEGAGLRDGLDSFGHLVAIGPENRPRAQLGLLGITVGDVSELVITHGDIDHVGGIDDVRGATVVVSRAEHEVGPPRYFGDVRPYAWPPDRAYRLVDGDEEIAPGVLLLATPGHSPGHLSILVRLRETGPVLLACDAISRAFELESGVNVGAEDVVAARRSADRLLAIAHREGALLVHGHDPDQRAELRWAPDVYR
jgi:N-acyl homoserine lactone hydrolase